MQILDAGATAKALPYPALVAAIEATIGDANASQVTCPPRVSLPVAADAVWLLMPAWSASADIAACKLITVHPGNMQRGLPTIQGDILVIRASTGERLALLDGPTVTARRTAAVTALALKLIRRARLDAGQAATAAGTKAAHLPIAAQSPPAARSPPAANSLPAAESALAADSPSCLIIGCGVQGRSHLEALHATAAATRFFLYSRSNRSAKQLAEHAAALGVSADVVTEPQAVLSAAVDIVACCTPAMEVCLHRSPPEGAIIAAIGSYRPEMSEIAPDVMQRIGQNILLDTQDARHEAGELVQSGLDTARLPTLLSWNGHALPAITKTVLFKSCGSALWDLAAAQAAVNARPRSIQA